MDIEKRFKHYEDRYKHELDVREKLEGRTKTYLSIFAIVFALIALLIKQTLLAGNLNFHCSIWFFLFLSCALFVIAIAFFIRAILGYYYLLMPTPEALEEYLEKTIEEYSKTSPSNAKKWAKEALEEYIFESYIKYTTQNTKNNDAKSLNLSWSLYSLVFSFIIICIAYLPFAAEAYISKGNTYVVKTTTTTATSASSSKRPASVSSSMSAHSSSERATEVK